MERRNTIQQIASGLVLALYLVAVSLLALPVAAAGPDGAFPLGGETPEYAVGVGVDLDLDGEDKLSVASLFTAHSIHPRQWNYHGGPDSGPHRPFSHQQARAPPRHLS